MATVHPIHIQRYYFQHHAQIQLLQTTLQRPCTSWSNYVLRVYIYVWIVLNMDMYMYIWQLYCLLHVYIYIYINTGHGQYLIYSFKMFQVIKLWTVYSRFSGFGVSHARIPFCWPLYSDGFPARDEWSDSSPFTSDKPGSFYWRFAVKKHAQL